ncbi:protein adenylyltransferase SelO family protein [Shewanella inventionis]|uniref:protein adenylyltransferase SelO n=1 Tax=Shewanella inventionis TaxID=1738770 RepID=UPI001CBE611C|nr:protein adenylyltransferase SelO family protein [Shewanella inventionis]UAL41576.1 protein adenylyltransferase SelO family protein [Shewanella inventionis]
MTHQLSLQIPVTVETVDCLAQLVDYSLMNTLNRDPYATVNGDDHAPRQVFSGHYVPVKPTPIEHPEYIAHSSRFFSELGFADSMAQSADFMRLFSGDLSNVPEPMSKVGWACGYALSIYGTEYIQQCPFRTGNGYGDGRAVSVVEALINGKRWEMQLKGGGRTPYCRGADGRAVLRSSVREFLAQEHMHALGVPTSRSLSLYVSKSETVQRPWYSEGSREQDPDRMITEAVAISTRVAPSFIRVGQLELFGRRARKHEYPQAMAELEQLVLHLIDREYADVIDPQLCLRDKVLKLASEFRNRLTSLVANWVRVGYCQGNFNSDNCAAGGFTLDYGPFGFCDVFNPQYQPWTGGGQHFAFLNQDAAAERNYLMFCTALSPLLANEADGLDELQQLVNDFSTKMQTQMEQMWASKLGLNSFDAALFNELETLMQQTPVDYTLFFRELSSLPDDIGPLAKSFYRDLSQTPKGLEQRWVAWLAQWQSLLGKEANSDASSDETSELTRNRDEIVKQMKQVNPKYSLREWLLVPAYQQASQGDYTLLRELQAVMTNPYAEQSQEVEDKYYRLKASEYFGVGGCSHLSCSS